MGEVYRARDSRLGRDVAVKVLPAELSEDSSYRQRLEREAKTISQLQHPNVCTLFDFDSEDGADYLVMELLEGETLDDRLRRGRPSTDEMVRIGQEIAEGLEAAHRRGVVHRDLKPGNVILTQSGAKVLDFGLARDMGRQGEVVDTEAATIAASITAEGRIVGTMPYMAPEQLQGLQVDARSDIWALGCVLYEMATGDRPFHGETQASLIASILSTDPEPPSRSQPLSPARLDWVVKRCLEKDPERRWQSARDVAIEIEEALSGEVEAKPVAARSSGPPRLLPLALALIIGATGAWLATRFFAPAPEGEKMVVRSTIRGSETISSAHTTVGLAISPDGSTVAHSVTYFGENRTWVYRLASFEGEALANVGEVREISFSQDGGRIAFFDVGYNELKTMAVRGGPARTLAPAAWIAGTSWGAGDRVLYGSPYVSDGLRSIPANGGDPRFLTRVAIEDGETAHRHPEVLPGGATVVFTVQRSGVGSLALLDLQTGDVTPLLVNGSVARYAATGHLVFRRDGALWAVAFDLERLAVRSQPRKVLETQRPVERFDFSRDGTLVYHTAPGLGEAYPRSILVWVDRQGREEATASPPRSYQNLGFSPDGEQVAVEIREELQDLYIWNVGRESLTRLTSGAAKDNYPVWTRDGRSVIYSSTNGDEHGIFRRAADGTGDAELLYASDKRMFPYSVSRDGGSLVYRQVDRQDDLYRLPLDGGAPQALVATAALDRNGEISPDGRWLVYQSNVSGRFEIYVRPFPDAETGRWQISTGAGMFPRWSPDGREIFYRSPDGMMAVAVETSEGFLAGRPERLFMNRYRSDTWGTSYAIHPDGRFLMLKPLAEGGGISKSDLALVQNWFEELKRLVPVD